LAEALLLLLLLLLLTLLTTALSWVPLPWPASLSASGLLAPAREPSPAPQHRSTAAGRK
jgi:hypothetical protein